MGCGESKHAVATSNPISQSKRSSSKKGNAVENRKSVDVRPAADAPTLQEEKAKGDIKVSEIVVNEKEGENPQHREEENGNQGDGVVHQEKAVESSVVVAEETATKKEIKEAAAVPAGVADVVSDATEAVSEKKEELKEESAAEEKTQKEESKEAIEAVVEEEKKESTAKPKTEKTLNGTEATQTKEGESAAPETTLVVAEDSAKTDEEKAPAVKEESIATESYTETPKAN